jgi:hypothetical protein
MTQTSAERFANVIIGVALVGAAYAVVRTPALRRLAWRLAVVGVTGTLPAWFSQEIREGWNESGRAATLERADGPQRAEWSGRQ